jgi:hypothetical protein
MLILTGWLLIPVIGAAWHYGPGQERMQLDRVSDVLKQADQAAAAQDWEKADELYDEALRLLPPERREDTRRVRLERDKAQLQVHKLPVAHQDLGELVQEMTADASADPKVLADARSALASTQYYMTWLMRLEGALPKEWEPEIEAARQNYSLLAERAQCRGDATATKKHEEDLEAAIRLARLDLSELQGLPLPSQ